MTLYKVPPEYWMANLIPLLDTVSMKYQEQMPDADKTVFQKVKAALISLHGITPNHYRTQVRDLAQLPSEPCQQYGLRVLSLVTLWAKETKTKADMIDLVSMDKMLSTLSDPKVQSWVRAQNPSSTKEASRIADDYIHSLPKVEDPKKWTRPSFQRSTGQFDRHRPRPPGNVPKQDSESQALPSPKL